MATVIHLLDIKKEELKRRDPIYVIFIVEFTKYILPTLPWLRYLHKPAVLIKAGGYSCVGETIDFVVGDVGSVLAPGNRALLKKSNVFQVDSYILPYPLCYCRKES